MILFSIFIQVFNFSVITDTANTDEDESWCFVDGLEAREKIYLGLSIPTFITIYFIVMYIICRVFTDGKITISCIQRQILFDKMLIELILLLIGSILAVLLKLMACAEVGNKTVHLHFGYEPCYESTWNISLVIMIMIVIAFSFIFIKLRLSSSEQRQSHTNPLMLFTVIYKEEYYYWEYVIFIRRICIAFYSVSVENDSFALIFITVLVVFLSLHIQCQPFVIDGANRLETILLVVLIIIVTSQELSSIDTIWQEYITLSSIFLPFILMLYFICNICRKDKKSSDEDYDELYDFMDENESNLSVRLNDLSMAPISYNATMETNIRQTLHSIDSNVEDE